MHCFREDRGQIRFDFLRVSNFYIRSTCKFNPLRFNHDSSLAGRRVSATLDARAQKRTHPVGVRSGVAWRVAVRLCHSCTAIYRMAIRTFEFSRYFTVACGKDQKIASGRLVNREVQMWKIGLADRRKST